MRDSYGILVSLEVDWIKFTFTLLSLILLFISFVLSHALCLKKKKKENHVATDNQDAN